MELRLYDPAIGKWNAIDPVVHHNFSPYQAFDNNPIYWADPSGANSQSNAEWAAEKQAEWNALENGASISDVWGLGAVANSSNKKPKDDITVNSEGIVTNVVKNGKPNRFFDEDGNELFFNDPTDVDKDYNNSKWFRGDRLYTSISVDEMNKAIIEAGIIFERYSNNSSFFALSFVKAAFKGHSSFDFSENWLIYKAENMIYSRNGLFSRSRASYTDDSGFFRFGNTNNIYNLYDGGNYMWGRAMGISGFSYGEIRFGSQANEGFTDMKADQRAIKNGFNSIKKKK